MVTILALQTLTDRVPGPPVAGVDQDRHLPTGDRRRRQRWLRASQLALQAYWLRGGLQEMLDPWEALVGVIKIEKNSDELIAAEP